MNPLHPQNTDERSLETPRTFEDYVHEYTTPLYRFIYRLTGNKEESEDLVQEVFLKAWKHIQHYNPTLSFKAWIFSIARNTAIDWLRKKKPYVFSQFESDNETNPIVDSLTDPLPLPDTVFEQMEDTKALTQALDILSPDQKTVILLKYMEEMTFEEIAVVLGKPMNTVKSQYRRGMEALREHLINAPK